MDTLNSDLPFLEISEILHITTKSGSSSENLNAMRKISLHEIFNGAGTFPGKFNKNKTNATEIFMVLHICQIGNFSKQDAPVPEKIKNRPSDLRSKKLKN